MNLILGRFARMAFGVALLATVALASTASAYTLRSPQVAFQNASLQGLLNGWDGGITTLTDQIDGQNFAVNVSGNADFTLMIKLGGNAANNTIGVYNAGDPSPALCPLFPSYAIADYSVYCHFKASGALAVDLYDQNNTKLGTTNFSGVTRNQIGFYIDGPNGTKYSQDYRNLGKPQVLTYAGTGANGNDLFECFNDATYDPGTSTFDSAVLMLESVVPKPVPTINKSWGSLKAQYR